VITILKIIKGHGNDWPIRYKDLTKWYDYVEQFAGISGQAENCTASDGKFYHLWI
jgi:choline dehydrogenase-like flavoprotein